MMFQAIRDYFARPERPRPRRGRGRRLLALFMFEFLVVVAGVLVAQMLQERMSDARARREAEQAIHRSRTEALRLFLIADYWSRVGPCLSGRVADVARAAATGGTMSAEEIGRPGLPYPLDAPWSESTTLVARKIYGQRLIDQHADLLVHASVFRREQASIARDWATFALLDPMLGPPSAADRANVRLAATQVRSSIKLLMRNAVLLKALAGQMQIQLKGGQKLEVTGVEFDKEVDHCGLLRQWPAS